MTPLTQLLQPIKERLVKATPGPWRLGKRSYYYGRHLFSIHTKEPVGQYGTTRVIGRLDLVDHWSDATNPDENGHNCWEIDYKSNATLIAHAPTDLARLLAALEVADAALIKARNSTGWATTQTEVENARNCAQGAFDTLGDARAEIAAILKGEI